MVIASSSNQTPFFTKISVSFIFRSCLSIPNVPRGEPGLTEGVSSIVNLKTEKAEELLGPVTPLQDVVAESVEDFTACG
jgi:hypothetical protein